MSHFYLDASAVVKRYSVEAGTGWVKALTDPKAQNTITLVQITLAEVAAALAAKHRAPQGISRRARDRAVNLFLYHCLDEYNLLAVTRFTVDRAVALTQNHRLRGCDAIQLAAALLVNDLLQTGGFAPLAFVSADDDLLAAARAEGLSVENPNLYP